MLLLFHTYWSRYRDSGRRVLVDNFFLLGKQAVENGLHARIYFHVFFSAVPFERSAQNLSIAARYDQKYALYRILPMGETSTTSHKNGLGP